MSRGMFHYYSFSWKGKLIAKKTICYFIQVLIPISRYTLSQWIGRTWYGKDPGELIPKISRSGERKLQKFFTLVKYRNVPKKKCLGENKIIVSVPVKSKKLSTSTWPNENVMSPVGILLPNFWLSKNLPRHVGRVIGPLTQGVKTEKFRISRD